MLWSLGKKSILKCCLPTIARFWQPLRYIHVTSTYKNILFDERKSDDFNKLIWRIPASPNTDRFLSRWFHRKAQDPTKATNCNHNIHKNYMKWLVQSNLQVILVIQWMYHYNLGRMTRNPTHRKTSRWSTKSVTNLKFWWTFSHQFCWDSLILSIFQSPQNGGSLGSQVL